jgi:hypothetical protein
VIDERELNRLEFEAFDAMPRPVRDAFNGAEAKWSALGTQVHWEGRIDPAQVLRDIEKADAELVAEYRTRMTYFAQHGWPKAPRRGP